MWRTFDMILYYKMRHIWHVYAYLQLDISLAWESGYSIHFGCNVLYYVINVTFISNERLHLPSIKSLSVCMCVNFFVI